MGTKRKTKKKRKFSIEKIKKQTIQNIHKSLANMSDTEIKVNVSTQFKRVENSKNELLLRVNLKAPLLSEEDDSRKPIDIVPVIDRSGSMGGRPLELCKE